MVQAHKNDKGAPTSSRTSDPGSVPAPSHTLRLLAIITAGLVAAALAGGAAVYYGYEQPALDAAHARILRYEEEQGSLRRRLAELERTTVELQGRLLVEESARRSLEGALRTSQADLGKAKDTIAFYEQLHPPGPKGAVTIRALDIGASGPHLKYRLLLMRSGANGQPFEGSLQFVATGRVKGERVRVELQPATVNSAEENGGEEAGPQGDAERAPVVRFTDFQRLSGVLGLPEGFIPEKVTLNVLEGKTVRVTREVDLGDAP